MNPQRTTSTMWYIPKKNLFSKPDDVLYAAEKYIEQNGTEAFERIIRKVCTCYHVLLHMHICASFPIFMQKSPLPTYISFFKKKGVLFLMKSIESEFKNPFSETGHNTIKEKLNGVSVKETLNHSGQYKL